MTRTLVITADDFGLDPWTSEGIVKLAEDRSITAVSALAVVPDLTTPLGWLRDAGVTSVGLHFTLTSEPGVGRWFPVSHGRSLRDESGGMPFSAAQASLNTRTEHVAAELDAQHARLSEAGLRVERLDSHCRTLWFPGAQDITVAALDFCLARDLRFRYPRSPRIYLRPECSPEEKELDRFINRAADARGIARPAVCATDLSPPSSVRSYEQLKSAYIELLPQLPDGTSEMFLHPSVNSRWARSRFGDAWNKRIWEMRLLQDPDWRDALDSQGIIPVSGW